MSPSVFSRLRRSMAITLLLGMSLQPSIAQEESVTLSEAELRSIVMLHHPIARQAQAGIQLAASERTRTRGAFDPRVEYERASKTVDGLAYYEYRNTAWRIPTWFGVEVKGGWEYLAGNRTPETETLGANNYVGVSLPLLKGLSMDKRRTDLRKATIGIEASENERRKMLNDLLAEALEDFWDWVRYHQWERSLDSLLQINQTRLELIRASVREGDRAAADTIEGLAQLNQWQIAYQEAQLNRRKAQWKLSDHLWMENQQPFLLPENVKPDSTAIREYAQQPDPGRLEEWTSALPVNNPDWQALTYQGQQLRVDRKFFRQELLPDVRFDYNQLGKNNNLIRTMQQPWLENNYRYGLRLSVPLRWSAERGQLQVTEWKIRQNRWKQDWTGWKLTNQARALYTEQVALQQQTVIQQQMLRQYANLLQLEWLRFRQGESSLFLVNARETRYQETWQKLLELQFKFKRSAVGLQQVAGRLVSK